MCLFFPLLAETISVLVESYIRPIICSMAARHSYQYQLPRYWPLASFSRNLSEALSGISLVLGSSVGHTSRRCWRNSTLTRSTRQYPDLRIGTAQSTSRGRSIKECQDQYCFLSENRLIAICIQAIDN